MKTLFWQLNLLPHFGCLSTSIAFKKRNQHQFVFVFLWTVQKPLLHLMDPWGLKTSTCPPNFYSNSVIAPVVYEIRTKPLVKWRLLAIWKAYHPSCNNNSTVVTGKIYVDPTSFDHPIWFKEFMWHYPSTTLWSRAPPNSHKVSTNTLPSLVATAHHVISRFDSHTVGTYNMHEMDSLSWRPGLKHTVHHGHKIEKDRHLTCNWKRIKFGLHDKSLVVSKEKTFTEKG